MIRTCSNWFPSPNKIKFHPQRQTTSVYPSMPGLFSSCDHGFEHRHDADLNGLQTF